MNIYLVTYSDYDEHEIHSVWLDKAKAEAKAEELTAAELPMYTHGYWDVEEWAVEDA